MENYKKIFLMTLGFVFFNIFFPFVGIYLNSFTSFNFPFYDYTFVFYLLIIFLLIPLAVIFSLCLLIQKLKFNYISFLLFLFILCFIKQIEFHLTSKYYIQTNILNFQLIFIYILILGLSIVIYNFLKKHLNQFYEFNKIVILISTMILIFIIYDSSYTINNKNINNISLDKKINDKFSETINNKIFILTFEKLARNLILDRDGNIKTKFKALKKLEKKSTIFTNFKSTSTQTFHALKSLYNGRFIKSARIDENKSKFSIFKKLNKLGYKIHYINDFINYPCKIIYVNCYKTNLGEQNIVNRSILIRRWIYAFFQYYIPHFILYYLNPAYEYDFKHVKRDETKETNNFLKILKNNGNEKAAYIAHFFLSDGYTYNNNIDEFKKNNLEVFDRFVHKFYSYLNNQNFLNNSLIFIMSDTGSDKNNIKMVYGSVKHQYYHENSDTIFTLVKNFDQDYSEKNQNYFSLFDFYKLFNHVFSNKTVKKDFEGDTRYNNRLFQFTDIGIIEYLKNDNKWVRQEVY